jgi:hypothetical protein
MNPLDLLKDKIERVISEERSAISLSQKLFGPVGLFGQLAEIEGSRTAVSDSQLYIKAMARFEELRRKQRTQFQEQVGRFNQRMSGESDLRPVTVNSNDPLLSRPRSLEVVKLYLVKEPLRAAASGPTKQPTLTLESKGTPMYRLEITSLTADVLTLRFVDGPVPQGHIALEVGGKPIKLLSPFVNGIGAEVAAHDLETVMDGRSELDVRSITGAG